MNCCSQLQSLGVIDSIEGLFWIKKNTLRDFSWSTEWECLALETVEGWVYCVAIWDHCKIIKHLILTPS